MFCSWSINCLFATTKTNKQTKKKKQATEIRQKVFRA